LKLFIDTANIEEVREIAAWGVLSGVTTNPTLIAGKGRDFEGCIKEITTIVSGPVSAEVTSRDVDEMAAQAREMAAWSDNVVIKLPAIPEGLRVASICAGEGIRTNMTLVFSANQGLLAARAGASYVSPFVGRLDDRGHDGMDLVAELVEIFDVHGMDCEVIAASIRHPRHVVQAALIGADIATIPYAVFKQMIEHPLTDAGVERFDRDWQEAFGR